MQTPFIIEYLKDDKKNYIKAEIIEDNLDIELKEMEELTKGYYKGTYSIEEIQEKNKFFKGYATINEFKEEFLDNVFKNNQIKIRQEEDKIMITLTFKEMLEVPQTIEFELQFVQEDPDTLIDKLFTKVNQLQKENKELKTVIKNMESQIEDIQNKLNPIYNSFSEKKEFFMSTMKEESKILKQEDIELLNLAIKSRLNKTVKSLNKIYDAKVHGDTASDFHTHCDSICNTLVVIESEGDYRYGGFTTQSWEGEDLWKDDKNAFLFSLNKGRIYEYKNNGHAIRCSKTSGPKFGLGADIGVEDKFIQTANSYTFINGTKHSFDGDDYQLGPYKDYTDIYINELEVFEVILSEDE